MTTKGIRIASTDAGDTASELARLHRALAAFRQHDRQATVILVQVFTLIATHPPFTLNQVEIARRLGLEQASISHVLSRLGKPDSARLADPRHGGAYLGLIAKKADPEDHRRNQLGLTPAGENLAQVLTRILNGRSNSDGTA